jgi:hypothetical protein
MTLAKLRLEPDPYRSKIEREFAQYLETWKRLGTLIWWDYEPVSFRLGAGSRLTPDFMALRPDGAMVVYEVKGSWDAKNQRDARSKIKCAATRLPFFKFLAVTKSKQGWEFEHIKAHHTLTQEPA